MHRPSNVAPGLIGWGAAGPLGATLLVGRTGPLPSLRWIAVAVLVWLLCGVIAYGAGTPPGKLSLAGGETGHVRRHTSGRRPSTWRGILDHWKLDHWKLGLWKLASALRLLAIGAPLLPVLYVNDGAYHHVAGGAPPGRVLAVYLLGLALSGALWQRTLAGPASGAPTLPIASPTGGARSDAGLTGLAAQVPLLAVTLMLGANYGLFGALQARLPLSGETLLVLAANLVLSAVAAVLGVRAWGSPASAAVAVWTAWLAFAPWREQLAGDARPGLALALGAVALALLVRRRDLLAGAAFGALGALVPPALAALPALACLGKWRSAGAGLATALVWAARSSTIDGLVGALAGTPELQNAALGAFHARLFLGPETLAATAAPPVSAAAVALNLGALATGAWLTGRAIRAARPASPLTTALAASLAMVVGLLLAGTTPRSALVPSLLALLPLAAPSLWRCPPPARRLALVLGTSGYLLAATSLPALATAGAPVLSRWPALASPPVLGLALLAALLALLLHASRMAAIGGIRDA